MQNAGKAVSRESLVRRKDGGQYDPQTAWTLAIMLMVSGVDRAINSNSSALRMACDAAADNRGSGPQKETMAHMSGNNSLMDKLMIRGDVWTQAEQHLNSLGLLKPIQQLFDGKDLPGLLEELREKRLAQERIERGNAKGRSAAKRALKNVAEALEGEACRAEAHVANLNRICPPGSTLADLNEVREERAAAAAKAKDARDAADSAKQRAMEAGQRHRAPSSSEALKRPLRSPRQRQLLAPRPAPKRPRSPRQRQLLATRPAPRRPRSSLRRHLLWRPQDWSGCR
jgi:hypothetical protein